MTPSLHQLTASMVNQINRVDTITNNLANANTTGFKQDFLAEGTFNNYLERNKQERTEPKKLSNLMNTIPKIDDGYIDNSEGAIKITGNKLDFALTQRDTYFRVQDNNGNIFYTRDGSFKKLGDNLVTQSGCYVLDDKDKRIDANNENPGQIMGIYKINFNTNSKVGNNNFVAKKDQKVEQISNINGDKIEAGALEASNVNSIVSMVSLIESQRKFEQSQKAIQGIDELNKKSIDSIGNGR